jgi:hypothetical protein
MTYSLSRSPLIRNFPPPMMSKLIDVRRHYCTLTFFVEKLTNTMLTVLLEKYFVVKYFIQNGIARSLNGHWSYEGLKRGARIC